MNTIAILYTTYPTKEQAHEAALNLLTDKLIGCSVVIQADSAYWWNQTVEEGQEWLLIAKTVPAKIEPAIAAIKAAHPYSIPCIVHTLAQSNPEYQKWLSTVI
jgi:periplasmic divalent cation tolerance protein